MHNEMLEDACVFLELRSKLNTPSDLYQSINTPTRSLCLMEGETHIMLVAGSGSSH